MTPDDRNTPFTAEEIARLQVEHRKRYPAKIPRTWTRKQWRENYRWLRRAQRQIRNGMTDVQVFI